jgi:hypothetical protein
MVKSLLLAGADVDVTDAVGRSPLSMASGLGGDLAITMMSNLLAAGACRNDGSLHNAARELNLQAMQILVEYRHDPDFPSPQHGGRSALGELCLHAADHRQLHGANEKLLERCMDFLMQKSDISVQSEGRSVLLLALASADPYTTTKVVLHADMWKHINAPFNQYADDQFTYSPTQYVERVLPPSDARPQLLALLRANRCRDVFYANAGPQPDDAAGLPPNVLEEEQGRKARLSRLATEDEDHARALARTRELASAQAQIWARQAELEEAHKQREHQADLAATQDRARAEEQAFAQALARRRAQQSHEMQHQQALTEAALRRAQQVGDAEMARDTARQARALQWERDLGNERTGNAAQLSSIRMREREETERVDNLADARVRERIREQRRLVESQSQLAANVGGAAAGAMGRGRQIGFVTEMD